MIKKRLIALLVLSMCASVSFGAILLDSGDFQNGLYNGGAFTTNYTDPTITDPATKFDLSAGFTETNFYPDVANIPPAALADALSFEVDIYGDGSGTHLRVSLYVDPYDGGRLYQDLVLGHTGWQHFSLNIADFAWYTPGAMTKAEALTSPKHIIQYNGPWNAVPGVAILDNISIVVPEPATLTMLGMGCIGLLRRKK